jgi:hypothetical protein
MNVTIGTSRSGLKERVVCLARVDGCARYRRDQLELGNESDGFRKEKEIRGERR